MIFTPGATDNQLIFSLQVTSLIPKDDSVRLLDEIASQLDYSSLYRTYNRKNYCRIAPEVLFKIIVYAYMNGIYSSRAIERACRRDINYLWLLNGQGAPDHNTIARFRTQHMQQAAQPLFNQLINHLTKHGQILHQNLFIDGTKIEANANRYTFVWKKNIIRYQKRLLEKRKQTLQQITQNYSLTPNLSPEQILEELQQRFLLQKQPVKQGKGNHKSPLQRDIEELEQIQQKVFRYQADLDQFHGRNSYSKTDKDATFMHLKEDHMRNGQLKPAYNIQLAVESEYIVALDIGPQRSDVNTLIPLLEQMEQQQIGPIARNIIADAGYESEENYTWLEQHGHNAYIKPINYEKTKTRKYRTNPYLPENMPYNAQQDYYQCPEGQKLKAKYTGHRYNANGYKSQYTAYEAENCTQCSQKSKCTKATGNRIIQRARTFLRLRQASEQNITSPEGIQLRTNRSIQVEGAFGIIKQDYGFRRFLLRGQHKVRIEMLLMAFGYNINKWHRKWLKGRLNHSLHPIKAA